MVAALWRGLEVFRPLAWLYAAYSAFVRQQDMARPWLGWLVLGVLGLWTVGVVLLRTRRTWVVGVELALACGAILSTRLVDTPEVIVGGAKTLPGYWPAAAVLAWAVLRGWRGGMFAAFLVGVADFLEVGVATTNTVNNIVILVLLGGCIGYCADLARDGHAALRAALRVQAQVRERDRLARTVHDGVLQTLSYIHRRAEDLGGEAHELALLAAEQERRLRALVSDVPRGEVSGGEVPGSDLGDEPPADAAGDVDVDLRRVLGQYADAAVSVIPPAEPVLMAAAVADELAAAVGAALDNVRRHAGLGARAWVLIEDKGRHVSVTIRDNGVGVPPGRLAEAVAAGRIGMAKSIEGRIVDLGGTVIMDPTPGAGTCLELTVSKREPST